MVIFSPNDLFLLIDFKGFFHYVVHLVWPPPSFNPWFVTLHLWSTFGSIFFIAPMVGRGQLPMMLGVGSLCIIVRDMGFHVLCE
jgi:hypothetical protein